MPISCATMIDFLKPDCNAHVSCLFLSVSSPPVVLRTHISPLCSQQSEETTDTIVAGTDVQEVVAMEHFHQEQDDSERLAFNLHQIHHHVQWVLYRISMCCLPYATVFDAR